MTNTKCQTGLAPYAGRCSRQTPPANQLLQTKPNQNRAKKSVTCSSNPLLHDLVKLADSGDPDVMFREGVSESVGQCGGEALSWSLSKIHLFGRIGGGSGRDRIRWSVRPTTTRELQTRPRRQEPEAQSASEPRPVRIVPSSYNLKTESRSN